MEKFGTKIHSWLAHLLIDDTLITNPGSWSAPQSSGLTKEHDNGFAAVTWGKIFIADDVESRRMHVYNSYSEENGIEYFGILQLDSNFPAYGYSSEAIRGLLL